MHFLQLLSYRLATFQDLPAIIGINNQVLPEHYSLQEWHVFLQNCSIWCVEEPVSKKLVGYCVLSSAPDSVIQTCLDLGIIHPNFQNLGLIYSLAILPEYTGLKIGTTLLNICLNAQRYSPVCLQVRKSNMIAQKLYIRTGFQYVAELPYYYKNENGYLMIKYL